LQPIQIGLGSSATSQNLLKLNFDYGVADNNGNVKSQQIVVPTIGANTGFTAIQIYTYDSLNRLKSAVENINGNQTPSWKQTFTFDRYGNRRFDTANTTTLPTNCVTAVCNPTIDPATNKLVGYGFDSSGNTKVDANGQTFTYDAENKQVEVRTASNAIVGQYAYDGDGKRVKKVVPATQETTIFVYDASGKMVAEYSTVVASQQDAKVSYLTSDHLGSPRINTDANGQVIAPHDYQPFGEEIQRASYGADSTRQKFTSYERDTESELDFAQARMYASKLGRFNSTDPINTVTIEKLGDPQQLHLYHYSRNNPLKFTDPSGMIIKPRNLTDDERKQWDETVRLANLKDEDGNYVNADLHKVYQRLDEDTRTFFIDGGDLGKGTAGKFEITKFTADGKDFTEASITLNFKLINKQDSTTAGDYDPKFEKFAGLLGGGNGSKRVAEIFGHEASHAEFALNNPADAVKLQMLINDGDSLAARWRKYDTDKQAIKNKNERKKFQPPPDLVEIQATKDRMLDATERYAQSREKLINAELQQKTKKKK
jgi:RHS repeat-associated protein